MKDDKKNLNMREMIMNISIIKTIHHRVQSYEEAYNELDHYICLRETSQMRLTPLLHSKPQDIRYIGHLTYTLLNIYSCIKCKRLTHTCHINFFSLSVRILVSMIWRNIQIRLKTQPVKKMGWWHFYRGAFLLISFMRRA